MYHPIKTIPLDVRLSSLFLERNLYDNYPPFQRDKTWSLAMKKRLIDSILRGFYIPAILVYSVRDVFGGHKYEVIDGQQRLSAIFEFMEGKFPTTSTANKDEPGCYPVEPNTYYSKLSPQARSTFDSYYLHFKVLEEIEESLLGVMFRRLQNQQPLSASEKFFSYTSETTKEAVKLLRHEFWKDIFTGSTNRKQNFQAALFCISLEIAGGYVNMTTPQVKSIAAGAKDQFISPKLIETMQHRFDGLCNVYANASLTSMSDVIPIYQSAIFLEELGCNLKKSEKGCLTSWAMKIRLEALERKGQKANNIYSKLQQSGFQREFWLKYLEEVTSNSGLIFIDNKRQFSRADKISAWLRQEGKCPECGKPVQLSDEGHHYVDHKKGGKTESENCRLVHSKCHQLIHAREQQGNLNFNEDKGENNHNENKQSKNRRTKKHKV